MEFPTVSYLNEQGELASDCQHEIVDEVLIKGLKTMLTTRHIDERMLTLQRQGTISFAMSSLGEEACIVASAAALSGEDWIYPQYREQGVLFWRDYPIQSYVHHMFCNAEDSIHGRQMPNHFGSKELNVVQVSSPIGTQLPHAAGCAYAMKLQGEKKVTLCYFGDGTSSEGDFHVGLNFAAVRKAPVIYFCRNNRYAISTALSRQFASDGIAPKGAGYGMITQRVDGNDFFAVHKAVSRAREVCLKGNGPVLIEAMTYRRGAHSTSDDPSQYRTEDEVKEWEKRGPIRRLRAYLEKKGLWNEQLEKAHLDAVKAEVTEAINQAKQTPDPDIETVIRDVYFDVPLSLREQLDEVKHVIGEPQPNACDEHDPGAQSSPALSL